MTSSPEYIKARDIHNRAMDVFEPIREGFQAGDVSEDVFLTASAVMKVADKAFGVVFEAEEARDGLGCYAARNGG